jgi:MYXO-CTERM domain-containing protein
MNCQTLMMMALSAKSPLTRPAAVGFIDSELRPVRCHWEDASVAEQCDEVIPAIEEAWTVQVDELGWPAPLPDEDGILDVYVSSDGGGGAYAYGPYEDQDPSDGRMGTYAYIVIDPEFETWIRWTMLHEFNHVLQYGIDMTEVRYIPWEGTATAAESWSDPTLLPLEEYITHFQATPWVGLLGDGWMLWEDYEIWSYYEYGAALWLFHLDATTGDGAGQAGLDLWLDGAQDSWDNEPDFLDAAGLATEDWVGGWMDFSIDRTAVGTAAAPAWAATYTESIYRVGIEESLDVSELPRSIHPAYMPFQTGVVYGEITGLTPGTPLSITADGDPSVRWAVLAAEGETGSWLEGGTLRWEARSESVVVGVVNLGPASFDSDDPIEASDVVLRIALADSVEAGGTEKSGGCGCSSVQTRSSMGWILLVLGVVWRRRQGLSRFS